jgi:hypothetical protein
VPEPTLSAVVERVKSINSLAKLYETKYSRIDELGAILDLHAYDSADFPINDFNRDSSGHLDHVLPSKRSQLMKAYFNLVV